MEAHNVDNLDPLGFWRCYLSATSTSPCGHNVQVQMRNVCIAFGRPFGDVARHSGHDTLLPPLDWNENG